MNTAELAEARRRARQPATGPMATRKEVADMFLRRRAVITEDVRNFAFRQGDPALAARYDLHRAVLERDRVLARGQFPDDPALPEMPSLAGNDYYAGMIHLADYYTTAANTILAGGKAPTVEGGKANSKEQPWADDAPEFLHNIEALKLDSAGQLDLKKLGRLLIPKGDIRFMRKGRRCKVHIGDFRHYLSAQKGGAVTDEAIDEYLRGVEQRKQEVDRSKRAAR